MTAHAPILRFFPLALFAALALLSFLLNFNGLYGQDAHEYLRVSGAWFDYFSGKAGIPEDAPYVLTSSGYPIAGALFRFIFGDAMLTLQLLSWLSYAAAVWLLERLLNLLSHGSRADSRLVFVGLGLALAPAFVKAGMTIMSDSLGLALTLAAFLWGLRYMEMARGRDAVASAVFMALAVTVRIGMGSMLLPLAIAVAMEMIRRKQWTWLVLAMLAGAAVVLPLILSGTSILAQPVQQLEMRQWQPGNFFSRSFNTDSGLLEHVFPNIVYVAFPLAHPAFCLPLAGLLLLAKKTDLALQAKRIILWGLVLYLLLLAGMPHRSLRFLLPEYALLLVLFFPAWDRMYCYGFYFFKRLTWSIVLGVLVLQTAFSIKHFQSVWERHRLETDMAAAVQPYLPPGAELYSFDIDLAMRSYLKDVRLYNLWEKRYENFPEGAFVLFNPDGLRKQWNGQNPMLNWDDLESNYTLEKLKSLPKGWGLYRVGERE